MVLIRRFSRLFLGVTLVAAGCLLTGCGTNELESPTAMRLKALATMYLDYAAAKGGGGPASEEVLKQHIRRLPAIQLETAGLDPASVDATFVSLRDQQPFVVIYGIGLSRISGTEAPVVAYEKEGQGGKRLLAYANTKLDYVDEARLKQLLESNTAKP